MLEYLILAFYYFYFIFFIFNIIIIFIILRNKRIIIPRRLSAREKGRSIDTSIDKIKLYPILAPFTGAVSISSASFRPASSSPIYAGMMARLQEEFSAIL